jgi:hypothetical protein
MRRGTKAVLRIDGRAAGKMKIAHDAPPVSQQN